MTHLGGKLSILALLAAVALPTFAANTVFIGFEDRNVQQSSDWDYNDIVGSITADELVTHSAGVLTAANSSSESGAPFWANASADGPLRNVGYCVYGGGNCGAGLATEPTPYLATATGGSVSDVYFTTASGNVSAVVSFMIAADGSDAGYYLLSDGVIHWANTVVGGTYSFTDPDGQAFGIAARNNLTGDVYRTTDGAAVSQFAIFPDAAAPEPATFALMAGSLLLCGGLAFRRRRAEVAV